MSVAQTSGQWAEDIVSRHLCALGLQVQTRNYRYRTGEIDLIMLDQQALVFVEVRYRSNSAFGSGAESVAYKKQQRIMRTAEHYLQQNHQWKNSACRFDVASVSGSQNNPDIDWIKNAFP